MAERVARRLTFAGVGMYSSMTAGICKTFRQIRSSCTCTVSPVYRRDD